VKHDCFLNISICVLAGGVVVYELSKEIVEMKLYLGTARELSLTARVLVLGRPLCVELTSDGVFVYSYEISNHVPK
jgi:hypothetical protein